MTKNAEQALENLVTSLEERCYDQDEEIQDLQRKLAQINFDISELKQKIQYLNNPFK
jgi:uncharacterized coiled-coil protein SlyX